MKKLEGERRNELCVIMNLPFPMVNYITCIILIKIMEAKINQVGILTARFEEMVAFYRDVLGFKVKLQLEGHAEFESPGVRFAIGKLKIMADITDHPSFTEEKKGQSFELAFEVPSPADVDKTYDEIVKKGATPVKSANDMPWNQRTAFFADPDSNIHEIFADISKADS